MKSLTVATAFFLALAQDDSDAVKKRLAEILREANGLAKKVESEPNAKVAERFEKLMSEAAALLQKLAGDDEEKRDAIAAEIMKQVAPEMLLAFEKTKIAANERHALGCLKTIPLAEDHFRTSDADKNQVKGFWVADVSGLYRILDESGSLRIIEIGLALADAKPCVPLDEEAQFREKDVTLVSLGKPKPKSGYRFAVLESFEEPVGKWVKYHGGTGRSPDRFGFCAYPAEYPKDGKMTFIISEAGTAFKKDTAGRPPEGYPADPVKSDWVLAK
jgi:hypothetical protein